MAKDVFILGGKRTAMGEYVGALKDVSAIDLGAVAAKGALESTGVAPEDIDHTVMGNALQTSGDAIYGARHVALKAGVPFDRPALTVNRLCGSGIQSIVSGAQMIQLGEAQTALVGGIESMSQEAQGDRRGRSGCPARGELIMRAVPVVAPGHTLGFSARWRKTRRQLDGGAVGHLLQHADGWNGGE